MKKLSHVDEKGKARMVDVSAKASTDREAVARGTILMNKAVFRLIRDNRVEKGDVLGVARLAGIMAAKRTAGLIPLCHPLNITAADVQFRMEAKTHSIAIEARVKINGRTGVEMEALTAVSVAALTIYDMCKAADKGMVITDIMLLEKSGGKSGTFRR
ncbi:MAG: cyclic pyranopterin monophosphate synthase MoaC [Nitrospirae bacterium]|nr:MAG: cyclic pyranopterin monophosphate synthase MoaC [Nitrospirota bacterium]